MNEAPTKPRVRVKAGKVAVTANEVHRPMAASYLRDTRSSVLSTRMTPITDSRDAIRRSWRRVAGIAQDIILNSGRLSGGLQQIISDTIGSELYLNPKPDRSALQAMGYDDKEIADLIDLIKRRWKYWAWNPAECDYRGKLTVPQQLDVGLRQYFVFGEATGAIDYMSRAERARYGIKTGTKVLMMSPSRLVQDTNEAEGLWQGVYHDHNGRPVQYKFSEKNGGIQSHRLWPARDKQGLSKVIHVFEPNEADDVRGISPLAGAFRKHIQHEMLEDATLQQSVLQTVLAMALTSELPSSDAFEALNVLGDVGAEGGAVAEAFLGMFAGQLDRATKPGAINVGTDPMVSNLAPGEKLDFVGVKTPGPDYQPFNASLSRDMARALGVTYASLTMDTRNETYSSARIGTASVWPVVLRRRERISAPQAQITYEAFLDEQVFSGGIPIKGGYEAFRANRDRLCWAQWRGPAKPSADDKKSADAAGRRLENYTTSVEHEASEDGRDAEELREQQHAEHLWYVERGMRSPYDRAGLVQPDAKNAADPQQDVTADD